MRFTRNLKLIVGPIYPLNYLQQPLRDGKKQSVNVTLKASSENKINADNLHPSLTGAVFTNTTATDKVKGVKVSKLDERSIAARYGVQKGDIIIGLNRLKINNLGDLRKALEEKPSVLAMEIQRNDQTLYLIIR